MKKQYVLFSFLFSILFILNPSFFYAQTKPQIVNLSLMLFGQFNSTMQQPLLNWLNQIDYHKWTIAIWFGHHDTILSNATFINSLKNYGELIPAINSPSMQEILPSERESYIVDVINNWTTKVGYAPKGLMMFQPDTQTASIIKNYNMTYIQGYCFEQYKIVDNMGMRGGWQQPYYASESHVLIPSAQKGIVILPHNIWDWRASLEISHLLNTHIQNSYSHFNNFTQAKLYSLSLIDATMNSVEPLAYVMVQHEWDWIYNIGFLDNLKTYINEILAKPYTFQMCNETAQWFNDNYASTPQYHFTFTSPYDNKTVEWLYNPQYRITRYDTNKVVGYVKYKNQNPDPYLTQKGTSIIEYSLTFTVDDFGNGYLRSLSQGNTIIYSGDLANFPIFYMTKHTRARRLVVILLLYKKAILEGFSYRDFIRIAFLY